MNTLRCFSIQRELTPGFFCSLFYKITELTATKVFFRFEPNLNKSISACVIV